MPIFTKFLREEEGTTAVEYAVMLAMILMVTIGAVGAVGGQSGGMWGGIESELTEVGFFDEEATPLGGSPSTPPPEDAPTN